MYNDALSFPLLWASCNIVTAQLYTYALNAHQLESSQQRRGQSDRFTTYSRWSTKRHWYVVANILLFPPQHHKWRPCYFGTMVQQKKVAMLRGMRLIMDVGTKEGCDRDAASLLFFFPLWRGLSLLPTSDSYHVENVLDKCYLWGLPPSLMGIWSEDPIPTDEKIPCAWSYQKVSLTPLSLLQETELNHNDRFCFIARCRSPTIPLLFVDGSPSVADRMMRVSCRQDKSQRLWCQRYWLVCLQLMARLKQRTQLAWYCRCQPQWADGCHIVIYGVCQFIATGVMVLGPVVPLAAQEVFPVVRFSTWVMVHKAPVYLPLLWCLPIVITWLSKEG